MTVTIGRRELLAAVGGATAAWPLAARAQQAAMPVIGYLSPLAASDLPKLMEMFRRGLSEAGFVEGRNVAIEYRFADYQGERLRILATDLIARRVAGLFRQVFSDLRGFSAGSRLAAAITSIAA